MKPHFYNNNKRLMVGATKQPYLTILPNTLTIGVKTCKNNRVALATLQ